MAETSFHTSLLPGLNIILHIRLNPQPLTKRSYKTTLCMCESCQAIFCNNILYREIARLSERHVLCTRFANVSQWCGTFVFISMGLTITFNWFGLVSWRIRYKYSHSWNTVLCNNIRTRSEQQQSSRSEQKKRFSSENV